MSAGGLGLGRDCAGACLEVDPPPTDGGREPEGGLDVEGALDTETEGARDCKKVDRAFRDGDSCASGNSPSFQV